MNDTAGNGKPTHNMKERTKYIQPHGQLKKQKIPQMNFLRILDRKGEMKEYNLKVFRFNGRFSLVSLYVLLLRIFR